MDFALSVVALLLLIAGFVVALGFAVRPTAPPWLSTALAAALGYEVLWLVLLARERDPYFDPDHVTRWEFVETGLKCRRSGQDL